MSHQTTADLAALYEEDETAWLDAMSRLAADHRLEEFDCENLAEYLQSMANRDRRSVRRRMTVLLAHLLKWEHQPNKRSTSWLRTIHHQRGELQFDFQSRSLRNYAESCLQNAYARARIDAALETGLSESVFPTAWTGTIDDLISDDAEPRVL